MSLRCIIALSLGLLIISEGTAAEAQNRSGRAAQFVAEQQAEERYRRLKTTVEDLQSSNIVLQRRLQNLESQLQQAIKRLTDQQADVATNEQLEALSERFTKELQKIENQRVADNKRLLEEIRKIANRPVPKPVVKPSKPALEPYTGPVYEVEVQTGYTISGIAQKYREQGHDVSVEDILRANPGLDPRKMRPGDIINVPAKQ